MSSTSKLFLVASALSGAAAVSLGAFGAHALKARLDEVALATWQTAVQYHFVHTLALLAVAILLRESPRPALTVSGWLFLSGMLLFSGSLYILALSGPRWLGPVTPLGGTLLISAWVSLLVYALTA